MGTYADRIRDAYNTIAGNVRLANAKTGKTDTGITDAVQSMIAGYGVGTDLISYGANPVLFQHIEGDIDIPVSDVLNGLNGTNASILSNNASWRVSDSIRLDTNDYIITGKFIITIDFEPGTAKQKLSDKSIMFYTGSLHAWPHLFAGNEQARKNLAWDMRQFSGYLSRFYNDNGDVMIGTGGYGIYLMSNISVTCKAQFVQPTVDSDGDGIKDSHMITQLNLPCGQLYSRSNAGYFSDDNLRKVTAVNFHIEYDIYQCDKGSNAQSKYIKSLFTEV